MRILAITDLHGEHDIAQQLHKQIPSLNVDVIVISGDITHFGNISKAEEILSTFSSSNIVTFFVPGNLDPIDLSHLETAGGARNLHGLCRSIAAKNFIGLGGCVSSPFHTPFELSEHKISVLLDEAHRTLRQSNEYILVSHNPPFNTTIDITTRGRHVGSKSLRDFILLTKPQLVICGHIHEAKGIDTIDNTILVNPGPCFKGDYALVDLNDQLSVTLHSLK